MSEHHTAVSEGNKIIVNNRVKKQSQARLRERKRGREEMNLSVSMVKSRDFLRIPETGKKKKKKECITEEIDT